MTSTMPTTLIAVLLGLAPEEPAARLEIMKRAMSAYQVHSVAEGDVEYRLLPDPVLRFTNTVGDTLDGAVFLWLGTEGRPAAAAQVFERRDGVWILELTSLSQGPLRAKTPTGHEWSPAQGGVEFKPIPGAPKPADTAEQRLRQMRALTRDITAEDNFRGKSWQTLRLLSKPFARYGKADTDPIDGALFAYVLTTDPEVYLMLEARAGTNGPEWQYAFAPSTVYEVKGNVKGVGVWSKPHRPSSFWKDPSMTFHVHWLNPGE